MKSVFLSASVHECKCLALVAEALYPIGFIPSSSLFISGNYCSEYSYMWGPVHGRTFSGVGNFPLGAFDLKNPWLTLLSSHLSSQIITVHMDDPGEPGGRESRPTS